MDTGQQQEINTGTKARGRKDQGQEQVIKLESLVTRMPELIKLHNDAESAATDFKEAVKTAAEVSGLNASTVSTYVKARAGDKFDEKKDKVMQLALVFEEVAP